MGETPQDDTSTAEPTTTLEPPATEQTPEDLTGLKNSLTASRRDHRAAVKQVRDLTAEIDALKTAAMTENEKALAEAEKRGAAAASETFGRQLAAAKFEAAASRAGLDLGDAAVLIDVARFVNAKGEIDAPGMENAVQALARALKPTVTGPSGGDMTGGGEPSRDMEAQIQDAYKRGDYATAIALKRRTTST